jgi:hypothetical protein
MGVDGGEDAEGDGSDGGSWRRPWCRRRKRPCEGLHGGRRQKFPLVCYVPLDGTVTRLQLERQGPESEPAFALGVEQIDRGVDDPIASVPSRSGG